MENGFNLVTLAEIWFKKLATVAFPSKLKLHLAESYVFLPHCGYKLIILTICVGSSVVILPMPREHPKVDPRLFLLCVTF